VIELATNTVIKTIPVLALPEAIAITPDGKTAYVADSGTEFVSVIDIATNEASPSPIKVGAEPRSIVITSDGKVAYVAESGLNRVSVIDTATNEVSTSPPIAVGKDPIAMAIVPN
jgi:YVTN family beta-propeller protein